MKVKLFNIISVSKGNDYASKAYDILMLVCIFLSIIPLMFKHETSLLKSLDQITVIVFIIDYGLRLLTADLLLERGLRSYVMYPFTPFAIIDLLSILPSLSLLSSTFKLLRILRIFKTFRVFKVLRYSKNFELIVRVLKKDASILFAIFAFALGYILISALVIFNVETQNFSSFFDSIYWAVTALTTVGYGDIYPMTNAGKIVSMVSSLFGVAIIALPSGVITASFLNEIKQ